MGSSLSSSCLPSSVAHSLGLPDENDITNAKYAAAKSKLEEGIYLLKRSEENVDFELKRINEEIVSRNSYGDKSGAMMAFKTKKIKEKQRDKTRNTRTRLETQLDTLFQSQFNGELHNVLRECNTVMQNSIKKVTPEQVQKTMDDLEDVYNDTEEISQALSTGGTAHDLEQEAEDNLYDAGIGGEGGGKSALEMELEQFLEERSKVETTATDNNNNKSIINTADKYDGNENYGVIPKMRRGEASSSSPYMNISESEIDKRLTKAPLAPTYEPYLETHHSQYQTPHKNEYVQGNREKTGYPYIDSNRKRIVHENNSPIISGKKIIKPSRGPSAMKGPVTYTKSF